MKPQRYAPLMLGALTLGLVLPAVAQTPAPAPVTDSVQAYAPGQAAPAAAPTTAPAQTPATAPAQGVSPSATQAPTAAAAAPAAAPSIAKALGFVDVIPAREPARIQRQLDIAKNTSVEADANLAAATNARGMTKAAIDVKKQEISTIDSRIKLADKSKNETDKVTQTAEKRVQERQKAFLERREALNAAEIDEAKATKKLATASTRAYELELQLAQKRQTRPTDPSANPASTLASDEVIRELERKTLEAQRVQAQAQKELADKDEDIAKRRLDLYQAQGAVTAGGQK